MALPIPQDLKTVVNRLMTELHNVLENSNPNLRNSFINAIGQGSGIAIFDFYKILTIITNELFPDTAKTELSRWGELVGVNQLPASKARGFITVNGSGNTSIPAGTIYQSIDGVRYTTLSAVPLTDSILLINSLTRTGSTATAVTASPHNLASGITTTISGADQPEYNVTTTIIVTNATTFTYQVSGTPITPATGAPTLLTKMASVQLESVEFGVDKNQSAGTPLSTITPLPSVINPGYVQYLEITGGANIETPDSWRARIIDKWQNPSPSDSTADLTSRAKEVPGVTRVWVYPITPAIGQFTIYFVRDNDDDGPIPGPGEVQDVKNKILEKKHASVKTQNIFVIAPTPVYVNFIFSSITPNTLSMQAAIIANLMQFFRSGTDIGTALKEDKYRCAINSTVDTETGDVLQDFNLTSPAGDIPIGTGELAVLGTISFT